MTDTAPTCSFADRICELVRSGELELPPLPELAMRLQQMLSDDQADAKKVAELIRNDPAVAAALMRIANSAAFGGLREVTDLNQAIARLGFRQVGSVVTAILLKGTLTEDPEDRADLLQAMWDHSVSTAFCARHLADRVMADPEEAFLSGLLHDVGRLAVLKAVDKLEQDGLEVDVTEVALNELMDSLHCELGHETLQTWKLPQPICEVALHHENDFDPGDSPLLSCVRTANLVTKSLGFHVNPEPDLNLAEEVGIGQLQLTDIELAALMIDIEDELLEVRSLF